MQSEQFKKIMRLMRRTNEKVLVADESSDEVVVMMPLETYEDLLDGFEPCDCGSDLPEGPDFGEENEDDIDEPVELSEIAKDLPIDEPMELSEDVTDELTAVEIEEKPEELAQKSPIINDIADWDADGKNTTTETLSGIAEEEEEEKFYLEPV